MISPHISCIPPFPKGMPANVSQLAFQKKVLFVVLADFHGANIPTMADLTPRTNLNAEFGRNTYNWSLHELTRCPPTLHLVIPSLFQISAQTPLHQGSCPDLQTRSSVLLFFSQYCCLCFRPFSQFVIMHL